jgi:predicted O-methyltransferase YrrM
MSIESVNPPEIERYVREQTLRETEAQLRLRRETAALPDARMLLAPEVGGLLALFVRLIGARRVLELGTFTGYSALAMALALPDDGRILACDVSEEWTAIARRHWKAAGVADRIELRLAPAAETLAALVRDGRAGTFDLAFVDADKASYPDYYEACLSLLRAGGVLVFDNTLWGGAVADESVTDADTVAIRTLNRRIRADARVDACLLAMGDGATVVRKR